MDAVIVARLDRFGRSGRHVEAALGAARRVAATHRGTGGDLPGGRAIIREAVPVKGTLAWSR